MKFSNPFRDLTKFETGLWLMSVMVSIASFFLSGGNGVLETIASLIGVTALIFVAKGYVFGQVLTVIFAFFYGIISVIFGYYGEMITYLFMTAPMAVMAVVSWIKHPYENTKEVEISHLTKKNVLIMVILSLVITVLFFFILKFLSTANLLFSTISVTTSFIAVFLTYLRSPYYALGYAANDIVLIILWSLAAVENPSYIPMILCFVMFLFNDIYGFYNWRKMRKKQELGEKA